MSFHTVIIDDQDARISYSGQWSVGGSDANYRHTLFSSQNTSASAKFTFKGTSMILMGDIDSGASCNATISLDGSTYAFSSPVTNTNLHQTVLWSSPTLPDDSHTFTYTVESCTDSSAKLWFDYFLYNSTSNNPSGGETYFVDDDSANLQYTGDWERSGGDGDFMQTMQGGKVGSSVQLDFEGSSVSVFGRVDSFSSGIVSALFSVDGSTPVSFATSSQSFISYNKQFFQSRTLSPGQHTLVVTPNSENPIWIDYLLIQNGTSSISLQATTDSDSDSSSHSDSTSTGKVVGSIIAGVSCIVLVIVLANVWLKCWNRRQAAKELPTQRPDSIALDLFPHKPVPIVSTSVKNRPIDLLEDMPPRHRHPYSGAMAAQSHTRVDSVPNLPGARTPEFVSQDPFADYNSPQPGSATSSLRHTISHRSHLSESSVTSRGLSSRRASTIITAESLPGIPQSGSTTLSSSSTTTSTSRMRTVVNDTDEHGYPRDKKGVYVLTQDGMFSSSTPMIHGDSGGRLDTRDVRQVDQRNPDEPPPMYSR